MARLSLTAVVHKEGSLYVAYCPEVDTVSQGPGLDEAVANLKEATELYLEGEEPERVIDFGSTAVAAFEAEVAWTATPRLAPRTQPSRVFRAVSRLSRSKRPRA